MLVNLLDSDFDFVERIENVKLGETNRRVSIDQRSVA